MGYVNSYSVLLMSVFSVLLGIGTIVLSYHLSLGQSQIGVAFILAGILSVVVHYTSEISQPNRLSFSTIQAVLALSTIGTVLISFFTGFDRPVWYFVTLSLSFVSIYSGSLFCKMNRFRSSILVAEVVVLTILYRTHRYYQLPTVPGNDTNFHLYLTDLLQTGEFTSLAGKYTIAHGFHTLINMMTEVTGVNLKTSLYFAVVIPFIIITVGGIYTITSNLVDRHAGVISAVFAGVGDMFVVRGLTSITPSSLSIIYFMGVIYIFTTRDSSPWTRFSIICLIFASIFSHHHATLIGVLIITGFYIINYSASMLVGWDEKIPADIFLIFTIILVTVADWMIELGGGGSLLAKATLRVQRAITGIGNPSTGYAAMLDSYSVVSNWLYQPGYAIFLFLGISTAILWLHPSYASPRRLIIVTGTAVMGILIYPLTILGLDKFLLPHRILIFLVIFLSVLAASAVQAISRRQRGQVISLLVIFLVVFFSLTTPYTIRNDPIYNEERVYRTGLTDSELAAMLHTMKYTSSSPYVDGQVVTRAVNFHATQNGVNRGIRSVPTSSDIIPSGSVLITRAHVQDTAAGGTFGSINQRHLDNKKCIKNSDLIQSVGSTRGWYISNPCE